MNNFINELNLPENVPLKENSYKQVQDKPTYKYGDKENRYIADGSMPPEDDKKNDEINQHDYHRNKQAELSYGQIF